VIEAAVVAYLSEPQATYTKVGSRYGCSWTSVWRWVGWLGRLVAPEEILAAILRTAGGVKAANAESMVRATYKGEAGFQRYVGWCVISQNLVSMARTLVQRKAGEDGGG